MRRYCRVTASRMALPHCSEESSRGLARRVARDGASAPFCVTRGDSGGGSERYARFRGAVSLSLSLSLSVSPSSYFFPFLFLLSATPLI